jgi:hypothetical protein
MDQEVPYIYNITDIVFKTKNAVSADIDLPAGLDYRYLPTSGSLTEEAILTIFGAPTGEGELK